DASTNDDFKSVRALPGWPQLESAMASLSGSSSSATLSSTPAPTPPVTAPRTTPPSAAFPSTSSTSSTPSTQRTCKSEDVVRLSERSIVKPAGLAYDAASGRFVVGDRRERKLVTVDERSQHAVDLVRSASAGFYDVAALEIDSRRGDLWVVSTEP